MTYQLQIDYSDDVLLSSGMTRDDFNQEARFLLAAKLYELGRLSSSQAATLCEMKRVPFLFDLPKVGVSMSNLRPEDADAELGFINDD
jgi:predicted HTH domain antitoxin